jgi:3,4-dihydroxy 2-butanone 4-phosphate synthase / GTP cyclohydrolase II
VFGSRRCDCGAQLDAAMAAIAAEGRGVVLYLRGHEGRGIGLLSKLQAYQLQDGGADTVDANTELGLPVDAREYSTGAQMLTDLGVLWLRLLTNNPAKVTGLAGFGLTVTGRVGLPAPPTPHNLRYLTAKRDRLGHQIDNLPVVGDLGAVGLTPGGRPVNGSSPGASRDANSGSGSPASAGRSPLSDQGATASAAGPS